MESRPGAGGQQFRVTVSCQVKVTMEWAHRAKNSNQGTDATEGAGKVTVNNGLERPRQPYSQQKDNSGKQQDLGKGIGTNEGISRHNSDCRTTHSPCNTDQDRHEEIKGGRVPLGEYGSSGDLGYDPMDVDG